MKKLLQSIIFNLIVDKIIELIQNKEKDKENK